MTGCHLVNAFYKKFILFYNIGLRLLFSPVDIAKYSFYNIGISLAMLVRMCGLN